ncbi:TPA: hypothetical protein ACMVET_001631 [Clostridioides difficile]|nr:hypothetical protein [Clostridioides difficile]HDF4156539.1 hypothetical protein [Clostridioides difficile]
MKGGKEVGRLERSKKKRENKFNIIKNVSSFILILLNIVLAILRILKEL